MKTTIAALALLLTIGCADHSEDFRSPESIAAPAEAAPAPVAPPTTAPTTAPAVDAAK